MTQQELELRLQTLQGEIIISEKTLRNLHSDIQNVQESKDKVSKELLQQIKEKRDRLTFLIDTTKQVITYSKQADEHLEKLRQEGKDQEATNLHEIEQAKEKAAGIIWDAEQLLSTVHTLQKQIYTYYVVVLLKSIEAQKTLRTAQEIEARNDKQTVQLTLREKLVEKIEKESEELVAHNKNLLDDMVIRIEAKRKEEKILDESITNKKEEAAVIGNLVRIQLQMANRLIKEYNARKKLQDEKDIEQNKKELWLTDREATVGRAYRETISRGGRVN